ncbi:hypothetical protein BC940DRAFT_332223 [Gongronella butleri]|nr:hypothetical protein BC940DRAFT_332223 [Gongronella butleri]
MGFTTLVYKPGGSQLVAGHSEGAIKFYKGTTDHEFLELNEDEHHEGIQALAIAGTHVASAALDGKVVFLSMETNAFARLLVRSDVPIRDITVTRDGRRLAVASDENTVRIMLTQETASTGHVSLDGHRAPVKSVTYDPKQNYLVSSACDGSVIVWDVQASPPTEVKTFSHQLPRKDAETTRNALIQWHPKGLCFAMPDKDGNLQLVSRKQWKVSHVLSTPKSGEVTAVAWSSDGRFVAATGTHKHIFIWDITQRKLVGQRDTDDQVVAMVWHPQRREITYVCKEKDMLESWEDCVPETKDTSSFSASAPDFLNDMAEEDGAGDEEDDDDRDAHRRVDQGDINMTDDDDLQDRGEELDDDEDDERLFSDDDDEPGTETANGEAGRAPRPMVVQGPITSMDYPKTFQPGATDFRDFVDATTPHEQERRYLDFNLVGCVYTIFQTSHSIVNVDFHDQSEHRNFHFSDYLHYTMAALGTSGLVFAVAGKEKESDPSTRRSRNRANRDPDSLSDMDEDDLSDGVDDEPQIEFTPSILHYRPLGSATSQKEWTVHMPFGENVETVAINDSSVIATTSMGYVRVYTLSGVQMHMFCLQDVVTIAARADMALIVCATSATMNKEQQNLEFVLFNSTDYDILQRAPLPVSEMEQLKWVGFSEICQPATYDSKGILRVLHRQRRPGQAAWVPVFDGVAHANAQQRTERYWPIGLMQDRLMCIILRGNNPSPYFPVPVPSQVELRMPVASIDANSAVHEENLMRKRIMTLHERDEASATNTTDQFEAELLQADLDMDKAILQLIQLACRAERRHRVLDLAQALHHSGSVDAAVRIATHHGQQKLAERLIEVKEQLFMDMGREVNHHSTSLETFRDAQVDIFASRNSTMSGDLSFVDRDTSEASLFLPSRKRAAPAAVDPNDLDVSGIDFNDDFDSSMEASPLPKRSR